MTARVIPLQRNGLAVHAPARPESFPETSGSFPETHPPAGRPVWHPSAERRRVDVGPPAGQHERRQDSDVAKTPCPWCGSQTSTVYRSKGAVVSDAYRRRRRCGDCAKTWPTEEQLDRRRFLRELAEQGVDPADLGLEDVA